MSKAELLQLIAALLGAFASVVTAVEARLIKRFEKAGATSSSTAIKLPHLRPISRWRLARLAAAGAIAVSDIGLYYFDQAAYRDYRRKRRVRALSWVLAATLIVLVIVLFLWE